MTSTRGRGRKLNTRTKLRDLEAEVDKLQRLLRAAQDSLRAAARATDVQVECDARELRELRTRLKGALDLCEKLVAVVALPAGPEHAERRAEVLTDALVSTRVLFDPFA